MLKKRISLIAAIGSMGLATLPQLPAQAASCGYASHYGMGDGYGGQRTSSGERMDPYAHTAASLEFPLGTRLRVTDQRTGQSVVVRVNDRGPYADGRVLDLSYGAFSRIRNPGAGETYVCYSRI
jgi:rare lipoprotein A